MNEEKLLISKDNIKLKKSKYKKIKNIKIVNKVKENIPIMNFHKKEKYFEKFNILKKFTELNNQFNIKAMSNINSNHLSNKFKSIYHEHCLYNTVLKFDGWICDICEDKFEVKSNGRYRCEECDFDICVKCRINEESGYKLNNVFLSKNHEHLLKDDTFKESNWICDVCDKRYEMKTIKRFRCERCDFDICNSCKIKEMRNPNGLFYNLVINIFYIVFIYNFYDNIFYHFKL